MNKTIGSSEEFVCRTVLDGGIRVVSERMPSVQSVSVGIWVRAGSADETIDNNGIAHFLEHMLFKGTNRRSAKELAACLESRGGGLNGATGKEVSSYTAQALAEDLPIAVDVLADLVQNPRFDPADIELEKGVVLAEMALAQDDPEELAFDHFYQNLFPKHPLGYFIYGRKENVRRFQRDDLLSFLQKYYSADRLVAAAAGAVDHEQFVRLIADAFAAHWNKGAAVAENGRFLAPAPVSRHRVRNLHQAHICMGVRAFGFHDPRKYALAVLDALLGGGMSSRLFQNIREKHGFTYAVYSYADLMDQTGVFGAYLACDKNKVDESINLLNREIDKLKAGEITEQEIDAAKAQVRGNLIMGMESSGRRMKKIGEAELYGEPHLSVEGIVESLNAVSPAAVTELVRALFVSENTNITVISP
mgnify:CR=1 FL=1